MDIEVKNSDSDTGRVIMYMFCGALFGWVLGKGMIKQNLPDDTSGWIDLGSVAITLVVIILLTVNIKTKSQTATDLILLVTAFLLNFILIIIGQFLFAGFIMAS